MIPRNLTAELLKILDEYPVVTILGPRQAGKTTLAKASLSDYEYCNLEAPEVRQFASEDPKGFLNQFKAKVILDEIQRVPELLSYIQVIVDSNNVSGQFVLTGSHQLALKEAISQSLAGRTGILNLYPLSISELTAIGIEFTRPEDYIFHGFLPRIHDKQLRPTVAYSNYYQTYVERDVRLLINLKNTTQFENFIRLLAGRVGQLMDYASLANDVGVSAQSIKSWLSILEASFIVFKLSPYFENFGKRVIKSPKYYFMDTGLLAFLLGIEEPAQISRDPLVGQMFENLVIMECLKARLNQGKLPNLYFFRDSNGNEVDLIYNNKGRALIPIEIKSAETFKPHLLKGIKTFTHLSSQVQQSYLIYSGNRMEFSHGTTALKYNQLDEIFIVS